MAEPKDITVSSETLERIKIELQDLTSTGREQMSDRLRKARELGDLKENADYHAAKEAQALMEARIRSLEHTVRNAVVREASAVVEFAQPGTIVKLRDAESGDEDEYLLAQSKEEKVSGVPTVTTESPLGKAIIGKKAGEKVSVNAPGGNFNVEILAVRPT